MNISDCCGAETKILQRSDHPHVYDDEYNLVVDIFICTECGKVLGLEQSKKDVNG